MITFYLYLVLAVPFTPAEHVTPAPVYDCGTDYECMIQCVEQGGENCHHIFDY